jgi:Zn finger protein HypA/HybF involved in hydrogenase expression
MSEPYHYSREPDNQAGDPHGIECSKCGYFVAGPSPQDALNSFLAAGGKAERTPDHTDLTCPKCGHRGRSLTLFGD